MLFHFSLCQFFCLFCIEMNVSDLLIPQLLKNLRDGVHQLHHNMNHPNTHLPKLTIRLPNQATPLDTCLPSLGTHLPSLGTHLLSLGTCHQLSQCLGIHQGSNHHLLSILWTSHPNNRCANHVICNLWLCIITAFKLQDTDFVCAFLFSKTPMWW